MVVAGLVAACTPDRAARSRDATPVRTTQEVPVPAPDAPMTVTTTDLDGNRVAAGEVDLASRGLLLDAGFSPTWLLAAPTREGHLLVATDGHEVAAWSVGPVVALVEDPGLGTPGVGRPALLAGEEGWAFAAGSGDGDGTWRTAEGTVERASGTVTYGAARIDDVLPDARWAVDGPRLVVPVGPTDEYGHAVLGDDIEASGIAVADAHSGAVVIHDLPEGTVLEGTGVLLADALGTGRAQPVVTLSDHVGGARVAVVREDGSLVEGPPIGTGNRWRHVVAVSDGRVVEVVTPHLRRVLQTLRAGASRLVVEVAVEETVASHAIGSRNLDQALVVGVAGRTALLGPAADAMDVLVGFDVDDGREVARVPLSADLTTNVLALEARGRALVAVGTADGRVLLLGHDG